MNKSSQSNFIENLVEGFSKESQDWFFESLVSSVNGTDVTIGITVSIGGILVSGELVSGHLYFEGIANLAPKDSKTYEYFKSYGDIYLKKDSEESEEKNNDATEKSDEKPKSSIRFFHIKNAKYFHPSGRALPDQDGIWFRGKINTVDGFTFGILSIGQKP